MMMVIPEIKQTITLTSLSIVEVRVSDLIRHRISQDLSGTLGSTFPLLSITALGQVPVEALFGWVVTATSAAFDILDAHVNSFDVLFELTITTKVSAANVTHIGLELEMNGLDMFIQVASLAKRLATGVANEAFDPSMNRLHVLINHKLSWIFIGTEAALVLFQSLFHVNPLFVFLKNSTVFQGFATNFTGCHFVGVHSVSVVAQKDEKLVANVTLMLTQLFRMVLDDMTFKAFR